MNFFEYLAPIMNNLYHPTLIKEWKQNNNAAAYDEKKRYVKLPSKKGEICRSNKTEFWPTSDKGGSQLVPFLENNGVYCRQDGE